MISINSSTIHACIKEKGAELSSLRYNSNEYIWQADPEYWGKSSPLLFPVIGFLKDNKTIIGDKEYSIGKHGLIRDLTFNVVKASETEAVLEVESSPETLKAYPFEFKITITFSAGETGLDIDYSIENRSSDKMPFTFGLHPAFKCPVESNETFEDYSIIFEENETLTAPVIDSQSGIIDISRKRNIFSNSNRLNLKRELFFDDALIFESINSKSAVLQSSKHRIKLKWHGFTSLGLWTPYKDGASFICIEPWAGMNDRSDESGIFEKKSGVVLLNPNEKSKFKLSIYPER